MMKIQRKRKGKISLRLGFFINIAAIIILIMNLTACSQIAIFETGNDVYDNMEKQTSKFTSGTNIENIEQANQGKNVVDIKNGASSSEMQPDTVTSKRTKGKELIDAVFIGDSRTEGLYISTGGAGAKFIYDKGLMVSTALTEEKIKLINGKEGSVIDALKQYNYNKVYIMFGLNELGWEYEDYFGQKYAELIEAIRAIKPNAKIYVQSILPVTEKKSNDDEIYNNANVKRFNKVIQEMAKENNVQYINVARGLFGKNPVLPEDAATDGIHMNKTYCNKWLQYIIDYKK